MALFGEGFQSALQDDTVDAAGKPRRVTDANPGALKDGPFAKSQPGYTGSHRGFAQFQTPAHAVQAQRNLLKKNYSGMSPAAVVQKYAPLGRENSEAAIRNYIGYISARTGLDPDKPVPETHMGVLSDAMREFETGAKKKIRFTSYGGTIRGSGSGRSGSANSGGPVVDVNVAAARDVSQVQASPSEIQAMSGEFNGVVDPFNAAPAIRATVQESGKRLSVADQILQEALVDANEIRERNIADAETTVAAKKALNDHNKQITDSLIERATPIWERRQEIADRRVEIGNMNPLKAALKGIFDPRYNKDYLDGMDSAYERQLKVLDEAHEEDYRLHATLSNIAAADFADRSALAQLQLQDKNEDIRFANASFAMGQEALGLELQGLQANSSVIAAQQTARNDIYASLTDGQLNHAIQGAEQSGVGQIAVNGVTLRLPELMELRDNRQAQATALESRELAIAQQRMGLADTLENNIMDHMNLNEVQSALANNGEFKGQQLDMTKLGARLTQLQATQQAQVEQTSIQTGAGLAGPMLQNMADNIRAQQMRLQGIFGTTPAEFDRWGGTTVLQMQQFTRGLKQAVANGTEDVYLAKNLPVIQAIQESQAKTVDGIITRWAGGNANVEAVGKAWVRGEAIDSGAAMRGLIHMARNGLPAGTKLTGAASQVFEVVKQEVLREDTPQAGSPFEAPKAKGDKAQRDNALIQRIQGRVSSIFNNTMVNQVINRAPDLARKAGHPFGRVDNEAWQAAVQQGDKLGLERLAGRLGMKPDELRAAMRNPNDPVWKARMAGKSAQEQDIRTWIPILTAQQTQATLELIDKSVGTPSFRPSLYYKQFLESPQFDQMVSNELQINTQGSFAGYVTASAAGGSFQQSLQNYTSNVGAAVGVQYGNRMATYAARSNALRTDPVARAKFILGAVPGLSERDETAFLGYLKQNMQGVEAELMQGGPAAGPFIIEKMNTELNSLILNAPIADPTLETIRKRVAQSWSKVQPVADAMLKRLED